MHNKESSSLVSLLALAGMLLGAQPQQQPARPAGQPLGRYPVKVLGPKVEAGGELTTERTLTISFAVNSARVDRGQAQAALEDMYRKITAAERAGRRFLIAGHADQRGSHAFNDRLSQARAEAVREILVGEYKVAADRLVARGFGKRYPLDAGNHELAWEANRRVELWDLSEVPEPYGSAQPAPRLEVSFLYRDARGNSGELIEGMTLRAGDQYRIGFSTQEQGVYVYVLQQDARRSWCLFPGEGEGNPVQPGRSYWVASEGWLRLDETTGEEVLMVLGSRGPLVELERHLSGLRGGRAVRLAELSRETIQLMGPGGVRRDLAAGPTGAVFRRVVRFFHR